MRLRVMLVERSTLVRSGLRRVLEEDADIAVVSEAGNGRDALEALSRHDVDAIVICSTVDREACRASAIAALRPIGDFGIVCVSHWTNAAEVGAVLSAGARGCVEISGAMDADLRTAQAEREYGCSSPQPHQEEDRVRKATALAVFAAERGLVAGK